MNNNVQHGLLLLAPSCKATRTASTLGLLLYYRYSCFRAIIMDYMDYMDTIWILYGLLYRLYITAQKYRFLPCGMTARTKKIYLFWGCGGVRD